MHTLLDPLIFQLDDQALREVIGIEKRETFAVCLRFHFKVKPQSATKLSRHCPQMGYL